MGSQNQPVYQNVSTLNRHHNQAQAAVPLSGRFVSSEAMNVGQTIDAPLHSSTPTKTDMNLHSPLTLSHTFSPIEKNVPQTCIGFTSNITDVPCEDVLQQNGAEVKRWEEPQVVEGWKPSLLSLPKTTMTSEELYAKIHKSKKQMKIKYEPEIVLSPSPSICGSQSPPSSERSVSPGPAAALEHRGAARSRHSWSPNSSKYLDIASNYDPRSCSPSPNIQNSKEHGLTQVTSTYDFKRLLLQHGTGTSGRSKLSAVERLKLAKQAATNVFTNNASKFRFAGGSSSGSNSVSNILPHSVPASVKPRVGPSKPIFTKPISKSMRKYSNIKSDVRSTPILEDNAEEEHNQSILQIQTLSASPMPARNLERIMGKRFDVQEKPQQSTVTVAHKVDIRPCPGPSQQKTMLPNLVFQNVQSPSISQFSKCVSSHMHENPRQINPTSEQKPASSKNQQYPQHEGALETAL